MGGGAAEHCDRNGDADLLITGHALACDCYTWAGWFTKVLEHADKVLDLYNAEKHRHLANIFHADPKTMAGSYASICAWILGCPDRALRLSRETDAQARRRGHPFDLGLSLSRGAHEFDLGGPTMTCASAPKNVSGWAGEQPARLWAKFARCRYGQALIREGRIAEGAAELKAGIAFCRGRRQAPHPIGTHFGRRHGSDGRP